jgi:cytochrome d ubiquinol oxidase subunit II
MVILTCLMSLLALLFCRQCPKKALYGYSVARVGTIAVAASGLFPFILPSSSNPNHSLTAWDATSSAITLHIMFWVVVLFLPIVLLYTGYAFRMMRGPLNRKSLSSSEAY